MHEFAQREALITELTQEDHSSEWQQERLDELHRLDTELGGLALFTVDRDAYEVPASRGDQLEAPTTSQEETLF